MAAFNKFNLFVEALVSGVIQMSTIGHTFSIMLTNTAPTSTWRTSSDNTAISTGNGYTFLGSTCQITSSTEGSTTTVPTPVIVLGATVVFTASSANSTAGIGPFRYAILLDQSTAYAAAFPSGFTAASGIAPTLPLLVSWYDYGSAITLLPGETFTVSFDPTSGILQVA